VGPLPPCNLFVARVPNISLERHSTQRRITSQRLDAGSTQSAFSVWNSILLNYCILEASTSAADSFSFDSKKNSTQSAAFFGAAHTVWSTTESAITHLKASKKVSTFSPSVC